MKIGLITYDFYPPIGGQGVEAYGLYVAMAPRDAVELEVVSASDSDLPGHIKVPSHSRLGAGQLIFSARLFRRLRELVRERGLDLLQVYGGPGGAAVLLGQAVPLVYVANHTYAQQYRYMKKRAYRALMTIEARGYRLADSIVAISSDTRASLINDYGVPACKVRVIPVGIDTESFRPLGLEKMPGSMLFAGRLCERKGLPLLLEALSALSRTVPGSRLYIIGEGELRRTLEDLALRLGISERIVFLGRVAHDELVQWYNRAEVFVLPSLFEGFGIVCLEAMACGTPIVASRVPGITDVIDDGRNGILVERDPIRFAEAIARVLGDPGTRSRLGVEGMKDVRDRFDWAHIADEFVEVYEGLIA